MNITSIKQPKMEMSERIEFCKNCKKRNFNAQIGIICGLTESKPEFNSSCENYIEDTEQIKKHKERLDYNPKKWKRSDNNFIESSKSLMKFDLFTLEPHTKEIIIRKTRFDKISFTCILGFIIVFGRMLMGEGNIEKLDTLTDQLFWTFLLLYPVIRYFLPYKKYILDSGGIYINKEQKINWNEIVTVTNYITIDNEDDSISTFYLYIVLNNYKNIRISLYNYIVDDSSGLITRLKQKGINLESKELIESIILSFHHKYNEKKQGTTRAHK